MKINRISNLIGISFLISGLYGQTVMTYNYKGGKNYTLVERTDLRRYENGKYKGLTSREVRSFISPSTYYTDDNSYYDLYEGNFYVDEDTVRASRNVSQSVHDAIPSVFKIDLNGNFSMLEDHGYPSFRSFPSYPSSSVKPGDVWEAYGERSVDPLNKGVFTKMPIYVQYTYLRDEQYNGEPVYLLSAAWATRYGGTSGIFDIEGDKELLSAAGKHNATIYVSKATGKAVVVRDSVDETFVYGDGNKVGFKGTISLFTEYPPTVNAEEIKSKINEIENLEVEDTAAGLRLRLVDLQFLPDSPELVPGEEVRIDKIATALKQVPESKFLIEGHTARTGTTDDEYELSVARARKIAEMLSRRGIDAGQFICKGSGGNKPIADNGTREGRARNRRVEITILE